MFNIETMFPFSLLFYRYISVVVSVCVHVPLCMRVYVCVCSCTHVATYMCAHAYILHVHAALIYYGRN